MKRILVLASGRGSNFKALLEAKARGTLRANIFALGVSKKDCGAVAIAKSYGLPVIVEPTEDVLLDTIRDNQIDLVVLAGYMKILSKSFIDALRDTNGDSRIINIHPSLLPSFPGKDSYTQAFTAGVKETGVTVHRVEAAVDSGPIIAQRSFSFVGLKSATEVEELGLPIEHELYAITLDQLLNPKKQMHYRIELYPKSRDLDQGAARFTSDFLRENPDLDDESFRIETAKAYTITSQHEISPLILKEILLNSVLDADHAPTEWKNTSESIYERSYRPGMTDNAARALEEAIRIRLGLDPSDHESIRAARSDLFKVETKNEKIKSRIVKSIAHPLLHFVKNFTQETWDERATSPVGLKSQTTKPSVSELSSAEELYSLTDLSDEALLALSKDNLWALNLTEMKAVQGHYTRLERAPTKAEMEVIAQTWSEHCKHKIFRGTIHYSEPSQLPEGYPAAKIPHETKSLFKSTIKSVTDSNPKPWLLSVFSDNAGILAFTPEDAVCIKVETHNSPSAIDPFAGAITGIGGVHRDIIGTGFGAKPIFNLDVFCVAPSKFDLDRPDGILPPSRILEGVRAGVEAGGNPAGIPTIAGALVFDSSYLGKPLIFCGSGGLLPRSLVNHPVVQCEKKEIKPGDHIVMVGGRVGRDGIHGATFSSLALDTSDPALANATVVQLGDPFTQKRALDFILKARDQGLFRTLTDNGAGGLSSSVGELATLSNGARLDLTHTPLKALGLRPEEILVSESQERMTVAVPPESLDKFLELSRDMNVESTSLGTFTDNGVFQVLYQGKTIAELDLEFLHEGCPDLTLSAKWEPTPLLPLTPKKATSVGDALTALLSSENIASKASLISQYDHEVQGCSLLKPETQIGEHRSPNQSGAVLLRPDSKVSVVVGVGILPEYSRYDAYTMAEASLDEAVRNVLSSGAEYGTPESVLALLDNFCWPDPVHNEKYAADLVRAGYGLKTAANALGLPFVSGKDSMKNDFRGNQNGKPVKISVLPTVLVTALGRISDVSHARTSEFKTAGDSVFLIGPRKFSLTGSQFERIGLTHPESRHLPASNWGLAKRIYSWMGSHRSGILRSCSDISEGGVLTAVSESLFAYGLGFKFDSNWADEASMTDLFGEGFHTFLVSVSKENETELAREWFESGLPFTKLGEVTSQPRLGLGRHSFSTHELETAWRSRSGGVV